MTRVRLTDVACSIARATDLFADAWTALIMRDVLVGITRFDDLAADLPISRKVLTARLSRLVEEDVLARERYQEHPPREHYVPTAKGKELFPVLMALMNWGDRWYGHDGPPVRIRHLDCGHDTTAVTVCAHCHQPLTVDNTTQRPGPGGRLGPGTTVIGPLLARRPG
ncbi:winged helix-turn-helix transcriptional regulator [Actinoplanes awajinensis]|uniref:HxlR family transcriptional regulator n=1 Tax=Actinoplanes awajinensis subsp. mycoplanecinus TaxID=135947 RepID=A0A101JHK8_9ACTN|nr:helix-turn-helix domain-containing protein [Actinoplanes awajinensis]KUL27035.1 HxlR family transcriptional regulator [Actinoplanes awajinensis subsp. mycoplanecinus]